MVAAAVIGGAVVGAVGSSVAGHEAAGATKSASRAAIAEQDKALTQQAELSAPYRALGESAIPSYEKLLGLGPEGEQGIKSALESMPGYQFALEQGQTGILNKASLAGGLSGNTLADLTRFNQGLATGTRQQEIDNLARVVGTGQAAAAGQAQNVGTAGSNIGSILTNEGSTIAGINASTIAGITKSIGNAADQYTTLKSLDALNRQPGSIGSTGWNTMPYEGMNA